MAVTLKSLSEELGLSQTTVSRALNGYPEVSERTRARVMAVAQRVGYAASLSARRLATGAARAIGHVVPLSPHEMINPIFADFIAGAGETYSAKGYDMVLSIVPEAQEEATYRAIAARRSVDGVIVHAPRVKDPRVRLLKDLRLPFLFHGRTEDPPESYSWLDVNNLRSFRRATGFLAELGHRRIALVNGLETMIFARRRRAGFEAGLADHGLTPDPALMHSAEMTEPYGFAATAAMLAGPQAPTAILCSSVIVALGAARAVQAAGLRLGRDVSLITHDDQLSFLQSTGAVPMFTATRSSIRAAGKRAAELLIGQIEDQTAPPVQELWETDLTVGASTGPAPQLRNEVSR